MPITYATITLASDDLAEGRVGPSGYQLNGRQAVDEAEFFRAATAEIYGRGVRRTQVAFQVHRFFSTEEAALLYTHTAYNDLPDEGDLRVIKGAQTLRMAAALESCDILELKGVCAVIRYTFRGGKFTVQT